MTPEKICSVCLVSKPDTGFYRYFSKSKKKHVVSGMCKRCQNDRQVLRRANEPLPPVPRPHPRTVARMLRDDQIRDLHSKGIGSAEIAKELKCPAHSISQAKGRLGITRKDKHPLQRLTDYAVEFSDTWDIAIDAEIAWADVAPEQIEVLIVHLQILRKKTNALIHRLNKEATGEDHHEQEIH